jgi:protein-S-isoprenylcysteine O-methyltransferase Ste14
LNNATAAGNAFKNDNPTISGDLRMLLNERLVKTGHLFFRYRGWQPLPMLLALFLERKHFALISESLGYELLCISIAFSGILIRAFTVSFVHDGTSGRNTKEQKASELNTTGAYSICRNPLYLANYLILLGISMLSQNPEIVLINTVLFIVAYLPIILAEEAFLLEKFGERYREYARRTNCIEPSFAGYEKNSRDFSFTMVLKREHDTIFSNTLFLVLMELSREYGRVGTLRLEPVWIAFAVTAGLTWITIKYLKKTGKLAIPREDACRA